MLDYIRIACAVPKVQVGDVRKNVRDICDLIASADAKNCDLVVFPELCVSGDLRGSGVLLAQHDRPKRTAFGGKRMRYRFGLFALHRCRSGHDPLLQLGN